MNSTTHIDLAPRASTAHATSVERQVQRLLGSTTLDAPRAPNDRRGCARAPFPHPIRLTPLDRQGAPLVEQTITVTGKDLSPTGLSVLHREPLRHRRMIASFAHGGEWLGLLVELNWCRFNRHGWCENGGRLLRTIESPLSAASLVE